ncbi:receptor-like protein EIX2 [Daucus carota subsp. sativus]|uniref:receptor-like protein EIX2 n=1 Tax=Daucus carota subsp. sativus TaxID=79200 RepID=UPI0007EFC7B8|nr:PREDICTED: leucine-rich repeat receptor protein kinase MSP1-like [Daucus carota subsp. sativus]
MSYTIDRYLLVLFVTFLLCMKTSLSSSESLSKDHITTRCIERERKALLVFKHGVFCHAGKHDFLHSWKNEDGDCCKWEGVGCNNNTGHVTRLHLSSLISPCYTNPTGLGCFSDSLLDLPYLKYLDISQNCFAEFPRFIGSLTKLVHLDFSQNRLSGSIPFQIGNLTYLQYLNLSYNELDGSILKLIGSLDNLRYLDLSSSYFISGYIPHELGNLSKLQHLDLGYTYAQTAGFNSVWLLNLSSLTYLDLSGINIAPSSIWLSVLQRIPSISVMHLNYCNLSGPSSSSSNFSSSISSLHLEENNIDSSIFNWLSHFSVSLVGLGLRHNLLKGRIPESLGHMTALTYLDLSGNQLHGVLPYSIRHLTNLQVIDFSANNFTGNLEDVLFGPFPLLQEFLVSENQLTGSLPDITVLSSLRKLEASSNHLSGYLPPVFEHHSDLQLLDLSNNHFRGSLPYFTGFLSLESLYLSSNEFSGSLPHFTGLSSLKFLHLDKNDFSGVLPDLSGCLSLQELRLGENKLTKWETQSTGLLSSLEELDLSMNSMCSTINEEHLFNLSSLKYLSTSFNSLTFEFNSEWLPPFKLRDLSLASCKSGTNFPNWIRNQEFIGHLDISNNQISDTIPTWFGNLSSVAHLNLSSNKIRGKFPFNFFLIQDIDLSSNYFDGPLPAISVNCLKINLSQNKFSGTLLSMLVVKDFPLRFLDISHNQLFGALPDKWMHLQGLVFLNLEYNNFSGRIPKSIGCLVSLRTLILRNNQLSGDLPVSIRNCSSLGFVDLGLNKLSGKVPSWIGEDLQQLYALILKSNRFYGGLPYEICHLQNLHFLDLSINRISGTIPTCFGNFTAFIHRGTEATEHLYSLPFTLPRRIDKKSSYSYSDNVLARWKGQEFEYGRNFAYLKMIDLSTNELRGEIPIEITRLLQLKGLNLSGNRFYGNVPMDIGQLKELECLDLSGNNFSGRVPSGTQLQGFNISSYEGHIGLCGKPLKNICPEDEPADRVWPAPREYEVDGDDSEYKRSLYISAALGFSAAFWGFIGTLVLNRRWRHAYFLFLYNLKEQFYVAMAVRIARFQGKV